MNVDTRTGAVLDQSVDNPRIQRTSRTRITTNTPGFRSKKPRESLPMNGFTYTEQNNREPYGVFEYGFPGPPWYSKATWNGLAPFADIVNSTDTGLTPSDVARVNSEALNGSLSELKGMRVNLGVAFGERKQTGNLLLSTAGRLANGYRDLRRGDFHGAAMHLGMVEKDIVRNHDRVHKRGKLSPSKALANEWLALQYGWKPLLSDVYNAAEGLAARSDDRRVRCSFSRSHRWFSRHQQHTIFDVPATRTEQGIYSRKYVYYFQTHNEVLKDLSAWGVTNPLSVAWELLPWSFVFDWFIPVGNYLDNWDATVGLTFEKGSVTTFQKGTVTYKANGTKEYVNEYRYANASARYQSVSCVRGVLSNFPAPQLPDLTPHITFNRGVSTLSLLRQRLKL